MAATQNKRPLPAKVAAMKARKRQRLEGGDLVRSNGAALPQPAEKKLRTTKKNVRLDELEGWKEVSMPDRLEDMEGFFGLEEIDDVDVIRDASGKISYQAVGKRAQEDAKQDSGEGNEVGDAEDDGDEWTGFGVEEDASPPVDGAAQEQPPKKKQKKEKKNKKDAKADRTPTITPTSAFAELMDEAEDEGADISEWRPLKLSEDTLSSLSKLRFAQPTPIQTAAIPEILAGHDVIGKATTGSGKTLAFGIPILERFLELHPEGNTEDATNNQDNRRPPLALILSPTRELAHQLSAHLTALCSGLAVRGPSIVTLTGGLSLLKQQRLLKTADVIIGTPGRLWEVISGGQGLMALLKKIRYLVVDEADRLLSQGHFKEVEEILNALERKDDLAGDEAGETSDEDEADGEARSRQTLVFSATFHRGLQQKLQGKGKAGANLMDQKESMEYLIKKLNFREEKPKFIDVSPVNQMAVGLKEGLVECAGTEKDLYLYALLLLHPNTRTLVFTNSISAVRRLTPLLQNLQLPVLPLHSQMAQKARLRSVERFSAVSRTQQDGSKASNSGSILVATDVAARGLDIPNVQLVIHYHLPRTADTYVHRSGRTARAGEKGSSVLICGPEEVAGVRRLIAKVHVAAARSSSDDDKSQAAKNGYFIRSLDIDRRVVARLKPRAQLAKQLADVSMAKEKKNSEDEFMRQAAEDLGVDYDSEEFERDAPGKRGRGAGRKKKEREARSVSKAEVAGLRAELKGLLSQRVNVGVSERYLTQGGIDVDELLKQAEEGKGKNAEFLGSVRGIGLEDV